jgi:hypothetical protein
MSNVSIPNLPPVIALTGTEQIEVVQSGTSSRATIQQISNYVSLYTAGTGLTLSGNQFSITSTGVTAGAYGSSSTVPVITINAQGQVTGAVSTSIAISASQITSGTLGVANGGTGTSTAFAAGSVVFAGASGVYTQKNSNFFWDNTNDRLGLGTVTPSATLDVNGNIVLPNSGIINFKDAGGVNRNVLQFISGEVRLGGAGAGISSQTFYTAATERMRISAAGGVSIGTTTDAGATNLLVTGAAKLTSGSFTTALQGSASASASVTYTLPVAGPAVSGYILSATTAGVMSWIATSGSGTVTSVGFTGGIITVATPTTTPAFTVAGTSGGIPYFSSASTWATSAALAANAIVVGGGAGVAPATITTGTGVVTALGVNTGTAGAFVVNGGVLGTPSSGTVTNLTGTASININGTVGATTPNTISYTTAVGSTSETVPLISGGTAAASNLTVQSTSGAGTTDYIAFRTGSQVEQFRILTGGGITSASLVDAVGYKGLPQNSQTASYTLALTDMGKMINTTTGGVVIPANASIAFPIGSTVIVYNNSAVSQTISITTDTLYLAGTATTGSRTLAQRGLATLVKVTATNWVASGAGVT